MREKTESVIIVNMQLPHGSKTVGPSEFTVDVYFRIKKYKMRTKQSAKRAA